MKSILKISFCIAAIAMTTVSCQRAELENKVESKQSNFCLFAQPEDVKTTMGDSWTMSWKEADQINVMHAITGTSSYVDDANFTFDSENKFTGTVSELESGKTYDWYAFYPYSSYRTKPDGSDQSQQVIGTYMGSNQYQNGNNSYAHICGKYLPAFGKATASYGETPEITMVQGAAVIRINVKNGKDAPLSVKRINITAPQNILGKFIVNYTDPENPEYTEVADNVSNIAYLTVNNGESIASGATASFYLAVKPFVASNGENIKLSVSTSDATQSKTLALNKDVIFAAGKIKTLNFTYDKAAVESRPYELYTGETIKEGDYLLVAEDDETNGAMTASINSNRFTVTDVAPVNNTITTNNSSIIWHIASNGEYWTIYSDCEESYAASSGSSGKVKLLTSITDYAKWEISKDESEWVILNHGFTSYLRRNGSYGFASYSNSTQGASVKFYRYDDRVLESIAVTTLPTKTTFNTGDAFTYEGLVVTATYTDKTTSIVEPVVTEPDLTTEGTKNVEVSYTKESVTKTTSYEITVNDRPKFTVTLGDTSVELTETEPGAGVELPTRTTSVAGYSFSGWSETKVETLTSTAPEIIPAGNYKPSADITLYPIFKKSVSQTTWTLITDLSKVTEGVYALVNCSSKKAFNGSISKSGHGECTTDAFSFNDKNIATSAPTGTIELTLTLTASSSGFTMYSADYGYLYAKAAKSGNLAWQSSESSYWLNKSSNWTYNSNSAYLRSATSDFRTYGSNSGSGIVNFAKKATADIDYYISTPE